MHEITNRRKGGHAFEGEKGNLREKRGEKYLYYIIV